MSRMERVVMRTHARFPVLLLIPVFGALASCGGSSGGTSGTPIGAGGTAGGSVPGVFQPSAAFAGRCDNPRPGSSDLQGTVTDENNFLRSWTNETYLWYDEVTDRSPTLFSDPVEYFNLLKTLELSPTGQPKDKFHFSMNTDDWEALSQGGVSAGYGAVFLVLAETPPRNIVVAYVEEGSPAEGELFRGDVVLEVDGEDAINGNTLAEVEIISNGVFPADAGQTHEFRVRSAQGVERTVTLTSANVVSDPVPVVEVFGTGTGNVGYIQFNDHISTAEEPFMDAIDMLGDLNVTDLILDLRYNGGGYLDLASEVSYMVANTTLTAGRPFERIVFNDKHPTRDPVTGETLVPTPFHDETQGFPGRVPAGISLPTIDLSRES